MLRTLEDPHKVTEISSLQFVSRSAEKTQILVKEAEFHFRMTLKDMITLIQSIQNILEQGERRHGSSGRC